MVLEVRYYTGIVERQIFLPSDMSLRDAKKVVRNLEKRVHYPYSYVYVAAMECINGEYRDFNFFWAKEKELRNDIKFLENRKEPGDYRLYVEAVIALAALYEDFLGPLGLVDY